jgi:CRP/FNR family transcriptional regulator, anaerobic regulatory protein
MADLLRHLTQITGLTSAEVDSVKGAFASRVCKKNSLLTQLDETENYAYYIADGCVRNYCIHDGNDYSLDFFFKGEFANSYMSS